MGVSLSIFQKLSMEGIHPATNFIDSEVTSYDLFAIKMTLVIVLYKNNVTLIIICHLNHYGKKKCMLHYYFKRFKKFMILII